MAHSKSRKKACIYFLRCLYLEEIINKKIDVEILDFIFYEQLKILEACTKENFRATWHIIFFLLKKRVYSETLNKIIEYHIRSTKKEKIDTQAIIKEVEKRNLEKNIYQL